LGKPGSDSILSQQYGVVIIAIITTIYRVVDPMHYFLRVQIYTLNEMAEIYYINNMLVE
jgi:hypothetical protein